jgi:hypothetical protein
MTNINRLPTRLETFIGAIFSLLLSSALGYVVWYVLRAAYGRPELLTPWVVAALGVLSIIFAWSSALFLRILFGSPELPSFRGQAAMGYFVVAGGLVLCLGSLLISRHSPALYFSQGVCAVGLGLFWVAQARKAARRRT